MAVNGLVSMPSVLSAEKGNGVVRQSDAAWHDMDLTNDKFENGNHNHKTLTSRHNSSDLVDEENLSLGSWAADGHGTESCVTATSTDDCLSDNTNATDVRSEDISLGPDTSGTMLTVNGLPSSQNRTTEVQLSVNGLISMTGLLRLDSNTFSNSSTDGADSRKSPLNYSTSEAEFEDINLDSDAVQHASQLDDETYRQTVCGQVFDLDSLHSYNSDTPTQGIATVPGQDKSFTSIIGLVCKVCSLHATNPNHNFDYMTSYVSLLS